MRNACLIENLDCSTSSRESECPEQPGWRCIQEDQGGLAVVDIVASLAKLVKLVKLVLCKGFLCQDMPRTSREVRGNIITGMQLGLKNAIPRHHFHLF